MKQIEAIKLKDMKSGSHFLFITDTVGLATADAKVKTKVTAELTALQTALKAEDDALALSKANLLSGEIKTLDTERDKHYKALRSADDADETAPTVDRKKMTAYSDMLYATMNAIKSEARELGERGLEIMARYGLKPESFKWKDKSGLIFFNKLQSSVINEEPGKRFCQLPDNLAEWVSGKNAAIEQAYADGLNDCVKAVIRFYDTRMRDYLTAQAIAANFYTLGILGDIAREIRRLSDEKNRMLIADTAELLTRIIDGSDVPFIYEKTGTRIRHYLIDEFQDTSALQWRNFRPLVADSLGAGYDDLIVGDVKQSIYRFRNSDWTLLDERIGLDFPTGVTERTLAENWRSLGRVVEFNNALFTFLPARRREGGALARVTRVVDAAVRGRVDLDDVERTGAAGGQLAAGFALTARGIRGTLRTVQTARQDARGRCLAASARPREQVRVRDAIRAQRRLQRLRHVLLPDHLVEGVGAIPAIQCCGHPPSLVGPTPICVPRRAFHSVGPLVPSA